MSLQNKIKNILVVEDNEDVAIAYANCLKEEGFNVNVVHTGEGCLDIVDENTDLILLDRRLKHWTGGELLDELGVNGYDNPVVLVTGLKPDIEILQRSFDAYVEKPVTKEFLTEIIHTIEERKEYNETIREWVQIQSKISLLEEVMSEKRQKESAFLKELYKYAEQLEKEITHKSSELEHLFVNSKNIGIR